jgi:hypothetical protein
LIRRRDAAWEERVRVDYQHGFEAVRALVRVP